MMRAGNLLSPLTFALSLAFLGNGVVAHAEEPAPKGGEKDAKKAGPISDKAKLPAGHPKMEAPAEEQAPRIAEPPPGSGTGNKALTWTAPSDWVSVKPSSPMRKAQYRVPGKAGDAELVVFYFGANEGGGAIPNAQRWAGQFTLPDGRRGVETMKSSERKVGAIDVLIVEAGGTYTGDMTNPGMKPNYMLLGAIAQGPDANWFFKLVGPQATIEAQRTGFDALVASLKRGK